VAAPTHVDEWSGDDVSVDDIERELVDLRGRIAAGDLLTRVMTHVAWVPPEWYDAARQTLAGMAERHPSRTILLVPEPDADDDAIDAELRLECFAYPGLDRHVCAEVIDLKLRGARARSRAPASIVLPLLVADLPAFMRWRGLPPFRTTEFDQLVAVVDRLVVDSTEWPDLPAPYSGLPEYFEHVAVSDIAWARTERWRAQLASLWPEIASV
jgi:glucose-6-phosphate dehydrogenase assembly protein OpcA